MAGWLFRSVRHEGHRCQPEPDTNAFGHLQKVDFTRLSCWQCLPAFFFNGLSLTTCRRPRKKSCHVLPNIRTTHINAGLSSTCMPKIGTSARDGQVTRRGICSQKLEAHANQIHTQISKLDFFCNMGSPDLDHVQETGNLTPKWDIVGA